MTKHERLPRQVQGVSRPMNKDRRLLRNLYLLAKHHSKLNRVLSNDLIRRENDPVQSGKDAGAADAYEAIVFFLTRPEILSGMDYNKIFQETELVPSWLQDFNTTT